MVMNKLGSSQFHVSLHKKGSSHFEIIISFILFVSFTLFLVLSLTPTKQDLLEESILYGVVDQFFAKTTTNVTSVLVDISKTVGLMCPGGQDKPCIPEELLGAGNFISQKQRACVYYIYSSVEFTNEGFNSCKNNDNLYSLGYIERQEVISNKTLQEFKQEYYSDYNASKDRFGVPEVVDFAVISNNYSLERTIPDEAQVIAGVYRKKVLYSNGSLINQDFIIKVW